MTGLFQDLLYALRQMHKSPGFTVAAVTILAFGTGMNTAVLSIVDATTLRLPFPHPEQLVVLENSYSDSSHTPTFLPNFMDWHDQSHSFSQFAASFRSSFKLTGVEEPQRIRGGHISRDYFPMLGSQPQLGRSFSLSEHMKGGPNAGLISEDFWRRQFGSDPAASIPWWGCDMSEEDA
jgi:hypothetical protein